jgi:hypothetical protein
LEEHVDNARPTIAPIAAEDPAVTLATCPTVLDVESKSPTLTAPLQLTWVTPLKIMSCGLEVVVAIPNTLAEFAVDCFTLPALPVSISTTSLAFTEPVTSMFLRIVALELPFAERTMLEPSVVLPTVIRLFNVLAVNKLRLDVF